MVILLLKKVVFPLLVNLVFALMPVIILGVGVLIMLRIVKVGTLSTKMGISYLARKIFKILSALAVAVVAVIFKMYRRVRRYCEKKGANSFVSNLIATIVVIIII